MATLYFKESKKKQDPRLRPTSIVMRLDAPGIDTGQALTFSQLKAFCVDTLINQYREHGYEVIPSSCNEIDFSIKLIHGVKNYAVGIDLDDLDRAGLSKGRRSFNRISETLLRRYEEYGEFPAYIRVGIQHDYGSEDKRLVQGTDVRISAECYPIIPEDEKDNNEPKSKVDCSLFLHELAEAAEDKIEKNSDKDISTLFSDVLEPDVEVTFDSEFDPILSRLELVKRLQTEIRLHPEQWKKFHSLPIESKPKYWKEYALLIGETLISVEMSRKDKRISSIKVSDEVDSLPLNRWPAGERLVLVPSPDCRIGKESVPDEAVSAARQHIDDYVTSRGLDKWGFRWIEDNGSGLRFAFKKKVYDIDIIICNEDFSVKSSTTPYEDIRCAIPVSDEGYNPLLGGIHVGIPEKDDHLLYLMDLELDIYPHGEPMCALDTDPLAKRGKMFMDAVKNMVTNARESVLVRKSMVEGCDFSKVTASLPHIRMRDGYVLDVYGCGPGSDGHSDIYVHSADAVDPYNPGDVIRDEKGNVKDDIFSFLGTSKKNPTPYTIDKVIKENITSAASQTIPDWTGFVDYVFDRESVWEMFLLNACRTKLPVKWHGAYGRREWYFSSEDFFDMNEKWMRPLMRDIRLVPDVKIISQNTALVCACCWSNWGGLYHDHTLVSKNDDGTTSFRVVKREHLVQYNCGYVL